MKLSACVIGAGPAGSSAALGLVRAGFSVTIFEQFREAPRRVCGAFLSPEAIVHLEWLGILSEVQKQSVQVESARVSVKDQIDTFSIAQSGRFGCAIPRATLEAILERRALQEGIKIQKGFRASSLSEEKNRGWILSVRNLDLNEDQDVWMDLAVAADGRFSSFRNKIQPLTRGWMGYNSEFLGVKQHPGELSLHFFPGGYIGMLAYADGITNVCGLVRSDFKDKINGDWNEVFSAILKLSIPLRSMMRDAKSIAPWKGVGPLPYGSYLRHAPGVFLSGDSAGVCDPFMGEGISRALASGPMLYAALQSQSRDAAGIRNGWKVYEKNWKKRYGFRSKIGYPIRLANRAGWTLNLARSWVINRERARKLFLSKIHTIEPAAR